MKIVVNDLRDDIGATRDCLQFRTHFAPLSRQSGLVFATWKRDLGLLIIREKFVVTMALMLEVDKCSSDKRPRKTQALRLILLRSGRYQNHGSL